MVLAIAVWLVFGITFGLSAEQAGKNPSSQPAAQGGDAKRSSTPEITTLSPPLRALVEKLQGKELAGQLEGAFGLGLLGESAVPAIPFLLETLRSGGGFLVEVDAALMKYFPADTIVLTSGKKIYMIGPVQDVASTSLAKIGKPAIRPLSAALEGADPKEAFFGSVTNALAQIPDPAATAILLSLLKSTDQHVRYRAAGALRSNSDPVTLDALIAAVEDGDESVRKAAVSSLEKRSGQKLGDSAAKWRTWREKNP